MAKTSQRRSCAFSTPLNAFDSRSVLLFAVLALGGGGALHAQQRTSAAPRTGDPSPSAVVAPYTAQTAPTAASDAAFDRADANHDGQLSAQEAALLPAIGNQFDALDTDKSGLLSRKEFNVGARP